MLMVRALRVCTFNSWPFHRQVTALGNLFTHVPLSPSTIIWYWLKGGDAQS